MNIISVNPTPSVASILSSQESKKHLRFTTLDAERNNTQKTFLPCWKMYFKIKYNDKSDEICLEGYFPQSINFIFRKRLSQRRCKNINHLSKYFLKTCTKYSLRRSRFTKRFPLILDLQDRLISFKRNIYNESIDIK